MSFQLIFQMENWTQIKEETKLEEERHLYKENCNIEERMDTYNGEMRF